MWHFYILYDYTCEVAVEFDSALINDVYERQGGPPTQQKKHRSPIHHVHIQILV